VTLVGARFRSIEQRRGCLLCVLTWRDVWHRDFRFKGLKNSSELGSWTDFAFQLLITIDHPALKMRRRSLPLTTYIYIARSVFSTTFTGTPDSLISPTLSALRFSSPTKSSLEYLQLYSSTYDYLFVLSFVLVSSDLKLLK
jgi:hypothetical protein